LRCVLISTRRLRSIRCRSIAPALTFRLPLLRTDLLVSLLLLSSRFCSHALNRSSYSHLIRFVLDVRKVVLLVSHFEFRRLLVELVGVAVVRQRRHVRVVVLPEKRLRELIGLLSVLDLLLLDLGVLVELV